MPFCWATLVEKKPYLILFYVSIDRLLYERHYNKKQKTKKREKKKSLNVFLLVITSNNNNNKKKTWFVSYLDLLWWYNIKTFHGWFIVFSFLLRLVNLPDTFLIQIFKKPKHMWDMQLLLCSQYIHLSKWPPLLYS
jgi:hypothetical protein